MRVKRRAILIRFLGILAPMVVLVLLVNALDRYNEERQLLSDDRHLVSSLQSSIDARLSGLIADITILQYSAELQDYIGSPTRTALSRLKARFHSFSRATARYDQIRLLDEKGMELVRVNYGAGGAVVVADERLQDKRGRYYFSNTLRLDRDQVFISQLDLNVENGRVEIPWKPMLRLGTPIYDQQGRKQGVLIFNYFGGHLLAELDKSKENAHGDLMLLNDRGYGLYGAEDERLWGFMFGREADFSHRFPGEWRQMATQSGQFVTSSGAFTFATVEPSRFSSSGSVIQIGTDRWWKLVSLIPNDRLTKSSDERLLFILKISPLVLIILALVSWEWARITAEAVKSRKRIRELSRVVEQSEEIVAITDVAGIIRYVNPAFERVTGYQSSEAIGRNPRFLKSGKMGEDLYREMWGTILAGESFESVVTNRRKDGSFYYEEKLIAPIFDDSGQIVQFVSTGRDISGESKLLKLSDQLRELAYNDSLTGLPNRTYLKESLPQAMLRSLRYEELMLLLFIDLDGFKRVNDILGHEAGDQLLQGFADRLRESLRETDIPVRYGGDEFLVIMEGFKTVDHAEETIAKILDGIKLTSYHQNEAIQVSASIGVTIFPFDDSIEAEALIAEADEAMYEAKKQGKNRFDFYQKPTSSG